MEFPWLIEINNYYEKSTFLDSVLSCMLSQKHTKEAPNRLTKEQSYKYKGILDCSLKCHIYSNKSTSQNPFSYKKNQTKSTEQKIEIYCLI